MEFLKMKIWKPLDEGSSYWLEFDILLTKLNMYWIVICVLILTAFVTQKISLDSLKFISHRKGEVLEHWTKVIMKATSFQKCYSQFFSLSQVTISSPDYQYTHQQIKDWLPALLPGLLPSYTMKHWWFLAHSLLNSTHLLVVYLLEPKLSSFS